MFAAGGEPPAFPGTFASSPRTCFLHGMSTERRLAKGDLVVKDSMGCYNATTPTSSARRSSVLRRASL
jgi:Xaa-Pro aminopeptidase